MSINRSSNATVDIEFDIDGPTVSTEAEVGLLVRDTGSTRMSPNLPSQTAHRAAL